MWNKICKDCHKLMAPMGGGVLHYVKDIPLEEQDEYIEYECPHCNTRCREETTITWSRT